MALCCAANDQRRWVDVHNFPPGDELVDLVAITEYDGKVGMCCAVVVSVCTCFDLRLEGEADHPLSKVPLEGRVAEDRP